MNKFNLLVALFLLLGLSFSQAQDDSTKTEEDWEWHWDEMDDWEDWTVDFGFNKTRPAISLQYGLANLSRTDIQSEFVDPNLLELKLGYIKDRNAWETDYIIKHSYNFLYLSNESTALAGKEAVETEIESNMWRFGIGWSSGYGYKLGENSAIIPYYSFTLNWSNINFPNTDELTLIPVPETDIEKLNLYDESYRFGTSAEGGVRVKLIDNLMLDAGYERSIVFQRHLFWKWAGSALIEVAAQGLLDGFISKVFESSPAAGPVVNFLLKNALAYGIYELRQDQMNWPFPSEAPIAYDQFKFGLTVVF
jgi:opacity protein-like surface antigen